MIYSTGTTCSGNGIAQSTSGCGATCRCLGGWRGPLCDRTTAGGRGDPHLETLDGVYMRTTPWSVSREISTTLWCQCIALSYIIQEFRGESKRILENFGNIRKNDKFENLRTVWTFTRHFDNISLAKNVDKMFFFCISTDQDRAQCLEHENGSCL